MKNKLNLWFRYCLFCKSKTKKHIYKIVKNSFKEKIYVYYCKDCNYIFSKSFLTIKKKHYSRFYSRFYRRTYLYKFNREEFSKKEFLDDYEDQYHIELNGCYIYERNEAYVNYNIMKLSEIGLFKAVKKANELSIFE